MKTKYFIYPLLMFSGLCACTPDEDELVDFSDFQIAKVELGADSSPINERMVFLH